MGNVMQKDVVPVGSCLTVLARLVAEFVAPDFSIVQR